MFVPREKGGRTSQARVKNPSFSYGNFRRSQ